MFAGGCGDRMAELLARKEARSGGGRLIDEEKVDKEFSKFRQLRPSDDKNLNLLDWPTSLASERLFNKDKLLYGTTRQTLTEEHSEGFIFLHDFLNKRMTPGKFSICPKCPNTPSPTASYKLTCPKHNQ